jgi:hypothetical protein
VLPALSEDVPNDNCYSIGNNPLSGKDPTGYCAKGESEAADNSGCESTADRIEGFSVAYQYIPSSTGNGVTSSNSSGAGGTPPSQQSSTAPSTYTPPTLPSQVSPNSNKGSDVTTRQIGEATCNGSSGECDQIDRLLKDADDLVKNGKLNQPERSPLEKVLSTLRDEKTLINIGTGNTSKGAAADESTVDGVHIINIDRKLVSQNASTYEVRLIGNLIHEGQHATDDANRGRGLMNRFERTETEIHAYTTEATYYKVVDYMPSNHSMWSRRDDYDQVEIARRAGDSVASACRDSQSASCR